MNTLFSEILTAVSAADSGSVAFRGLVLQVCTGGYISLPLFAALDADRANLLLRLLSHYHQTDPSDSDLRDLAFACQYSSDFSLIAVLIEEHSEALSFELDAAQCANA